MTAKTHCGFVAIIGRPNVGKSTLLNTIMATKVSITSRKPQTTRQQILAVKTTEHRQTIFIDTPGIHDDGKNLLNRQMNRAAKSSLNDVDCILWLVEANVYTEGDEAVLQLLKTIDRPKILVLTKIDKVADKSKLLPMIEKYQALDTFSNIIPTSSLREENLDVLLEAISAKLPEGPFHFSPEQITDKSNQFLVAEIVREKLIRHTAQELPYTTSVEVESWQKKDEVNHIHVLIWVERDGQKRIVIGKNGEKLKTIGTQARKDMEAMLGEKVFLKIWVKVKADWSNDKKFLHELGYYE